MKKRGQAWGFDLMVASVIFITGIIIFFLYSLNYPTETQENLNALFYQGNRIANDLLSEGYPPGWNTTNVVKIGILSNEEINQTKLEMFNQLDYTNTKYLFNTRYDYFINFSEPIIIDENEIQFIGLRSAETQSIIKVSRIVAYKNKSTVLNIHIWED
ncbi:hypothetical protein COU62_00560 [Candidatus Pacearchaeota archaeon CG10_big_fil_rev_8_21_14_0_10_35_219]|nr:hypothetical protein [Candidatus Pacearchaeota archaeon]OIO42694.1 MAG: hypothetical protein AUJ63_02165 [Candidatus Pacearchaeota archaeon CG1_02_35_32]PIO08282.1 MAG: hypothetical protein COU62_00560 [Candidatus Pacearchaeota archaeon CG10_big_fil_rev_8_21_14_0_10_35_219]PIY81883.1 MAG: hypothetical protein COY79_00300 [Candidatus Pacearchaeota archaeon CG_4_10_14_0_8_um_filter_35_169]PIZ79376.1 MAG: hypothetical protein COY00_04335 [Candidatus Pacearchaeota archaeon CG_4_10_14_0_2_um_filt